MSYELGEKARMLDRRLTVNASIYYEDWRHPQLESYPNDWALNVNGNSVSIYGADIDVVAELGAGLQFELAAGYLYARAMSVMRHNPVVCAGAANDRADAPCDPVSECGQVYASIM